MKYIFIIQIVFFLTYSSCVPEGSTTGIYIVNNSNSNIEVMFGTGIGTGSLRSYPDTLLPYQLKLPFITIISKHSRGVGYSMREPREAIFSILPADTLSIYIFSVDTLNKYSWSQIVSGYKILKRYDLSLQDLEKMNWTITYP